MFVRDVFSQKTLFSYSFGLLLSVTTAAALAEGPTASEGLFAQGTAADAPADADIPPGQSVKVGSLGQIDLHIKDLDISRVLQLLSIQSQRNIVASRNVAGNVSADLYGVEFYDALDAILQPNGFGYREKGNFVYVYTAAELKEIEEKERKLITRVIRLNYITAADASAFVSPLLSSSGSISLSGEASGGFQPTVADGGAKSFAHTDTLVIRDYSENVDEIVALLADLDVRPKQVLIEATILQADLDEANALGTDFSILADYNLNQFVKPLNTVDALINGTVNGEADSIFQAVGSGESIQSTVGNTVNGPSGVKFGILNDEFAVFVRALDRVTDTTIVANPKLLVLNRQKADLLVGRKLGYLSTTSTDTSTTQTVEFLEVGTQLTVRPFIGDDDVIRLELKPSISDGSTASVEGVVIPTEVTQELTTNIMIHSGQTVVMGGLFKEDTVASRSQWPILGDLPIAGGAFKGKDDTVKRSEVIFLIKPTVIKDEVLYEISDQTAQGVEHIRLGARKGLLPWARSKLVAGHMSDALTHYKTGQTNKALWSLNLALWLEPHNVEARQLKEEISEQSLDEWLKNGIIQKAIDDMVDQELSGPESRNTRSTPADNQSSDAAANQRATQNVQINSTGTQRNTGTEQTQINVTRSQGGTPAQRGPADNAGNQPVTAEESAAVPNTSEASVDASEIDPSQVETVQSDPGAENTSGNDSGR